MEREKAEAYARRIFELFQERGLAKQDRAEDVLSAILAGLMEPTDPPPPRTT